MEIDTHCSCRNNMLDFFMDNMTGVLDKEQTLMALKIRKLFNQLVFGTEKSLQNLHFEGRELV